MPASGVKICDKVKIIYNEVKMKHKHNHVFLKIENENEVVVEYCDEEKKPGEVKKKGEDCYKEFYERICELNEKKECRYAIIDVEVDNPKTDGKMSKIVLVQWCPTDSKVKNKMLYASTFHSLKSNLVGFSQCIEATDLGDLEWLAVEEKVKGS